MIKKSKSMAAADAFIISRVKQYLEENVHQTYVDVAVMAKCLQERYEEYGRRKSVPFRAMVEQAYKTVLHSYGLDSNPSSDNDASDLEFMDTSVNSNQMNDMLTNLYTKQTNNRNNNKQQSVNDNELIDIISSDESGDEKQTDNNKNNNAKKSTTTQPTHQIVSLRNVTVSKVGSKTNSADNADTGEKRNVAASFGQQPTGPVSKKRKSNKQSEPEQTQQLSKLLSSKSGSGGAGNGTDTATSNRAKRFKKVVNVQHSQYTFRDMGGVDKVLKELCELLFHIKHPEIYHTIGLSPPTGILLHGPPGCGKTLLAHAIAGQLKFGLIEVPATELIAGVSGESEERIREIFEQALTVAPCVLFIDDIDAISSNRLNAQRDMERRVVSQLISCMDNLSKHESGEHVMVIGATTRPECLDPALRRVGRFDHEIALGVPSKIEREEILIIICEVLSLEMPFDYSKIAELTPGYVGADLLALVTRAASIAVKRKYMSKLQRLGEEHTIPIVDLIDESHLDTTENDPKVFTENQPEEEIQENDITTTNNSKNENTDAGEQKKKVNENQNGELSEISKETEEKSDEKTHSESDKNEINIEEESNKENEDKMEVDASNEKDKVEEIDKTKDDSETIDVDELPDDAVPPKILLASEGIQPKTKSVDSVRKTKIVLPAKRNLSLFEMTKLLNSEAIPIQDYELEDICIAMTDFIEALKYVQPSAKREGFITVPDVTWSDIGSLHDIREELQLAILAPVKYPQKMEALGLNAPSGVLLCGPPGCGKTLLAKAIANEAGINFISVKGPELMNMYVGESERAVRTCFQRARNSAPCVIFFDEFDSLCPKRSDSAEGGSGTRVVNQLLTEMDGIEERKGVFLMAATNRPDIIDPAILRPGRLDTILFVGLPEQKDREEILNALTKLRTKPVLEDNVDLLQIATQTDGFTGADLAGLVRQASLLALKESLSDPESKAEDLKVTNQHFMNAIKLVKPSVSLEDRKLYDKLKMKYAAPRGDNQSSKTSTIHTI